MSEPGTSKPQAQRSPFWQFSVAFYAVPGVAPACIRLQDEGGVDVNLLFFLLWNAKQKRALTAAEVEELDCLIAGWRSTTVIPLREMRRTLKGAPPLGTREETEAFRNRVKAAELEAERLQQEALYARTQSGPLGKPAASAIEAARTSVAAYTTMLRAVPREPLDTVLGGFAQYAGNG